MRAASRARPLRRPRARCSLLARNPRAALVADENGLRRGDRGRESGASAADAFDAAALDAPRGAPGALAGRGRDRGRARLRRGAARPRGRDAEAHRARGRSFPGRGGWRRVGTTAATTAPARGSTRSWRSPRARPAAAPAIPARSRPRGRASPATSTAALVRVVQEHIAAGDIYQANLSQRFQLPWAAGGLDLYAASRTISPAPFAGYLRAGGLEIVSASPERLLSVRRRHAPPRAPRRHAPALRRSPRRPRARRRAAAEREGARRAPDAGRPRAQRPRPRGGHRQRRTSTS